MSSINTDAAVILNVGSLRSKSGNGEESDRGAPEIGKAYYINRNLDECASSLSSLSGGITNISKLRFATLRDGSSGGDVEQGSVDVEAIFREDSIGRGTSEGDGSSMSSLTNDLAHRGGNARFSPFARLSKFQVQLDDVVDNSFDYDDANQQQERGGIVNNGAISSEADSSPWYSVQAKHVPLQPGMAHNELSTQESTKTPATSQVAFNAPERKMMADKKHLEELVQLPPTASGSPGKKSAKRVNDDLDLTLDGSQLYPPSEYTRGSGWSEDFATYVRRSFDRTSRRRRYVIGFVVVLFLLCVMAMVVASLGAKQGVDEGVASYQEVAKPQDDERTIELGGLSNSSLAPDESPSASDVFPSLADGPSTAAASTVQSTQTTIASTQSSQEEPSLADGEGHDVDSTDSSHQSSQPPTNATTITTQQPPTTSSSQAMDDSETQDELVQGSTQASATSTEAQVTGEPETTSTTTTTTTTTSSSSTSTTTPKQSIVTSTVPPLPPATITSTATTTPPPPPETTTSTTTTSTTTSTTTPGPTVLSLSVIADTSIFKNRPDKSYHAQSQLTVKGQRKASSYLMFDTSRISRSFVATATLSVYSIIPVDDDGNGAVGGLDNVNVDLLPTAGRWNGASVTFDNPVPGRYYGVNSFSVEGYPYSRDTLFGRLQKKHDVDVTMAFRHSTTHTPNVDVISFVVYSDDDSNGRVDFASTEWNNGFAKPELVIELSDTASPTISPTTKAPTTRAPTPPPTPPPTKPSVCELDCNAEADKKFEKELGFVTLADWVDDCRSNPACDRKCKDKCPQDAEKEALKASRKRNEHLAKCLPKCLDANGVPLAPERYQLFNSKKM